MSIVISNYITNITNDLENGVLFTEGSGAKLSRPI